MQGVEPAAGLIDRLADVVGGELRLELILVLEGIVPLGVGHGTRVKPDVDEIEDADHLAAAFGARIHDGIDVWPMEVEVAQVAAGLIGQLLDGADAVAMLAIGALPDGQRRAPVALTAQGPVDVVLKPVAEAPLAGCGRGPS